MTEHWSLLATRNITYTAVFSRANILLTFVSAAVVALALVAQVTAMVGVLLIYAERRITERGRGMVHPRFSR